LDISLTQWFLDAQFNGVLPDGSVTLGDDNDLTEHVSTLVGKRENDLVVDVVPVLPGQSLDVDSDSIQTPFPLLDDDPTTTAFNPFIAPRVTLLHSVGQYFDWNFVPCGFVRDHPREQSGSVALWSGIVGS
jgi:hypothetical protein